jgi:hypothetical protein
MKFALKAVVMMIPNGGSTPYISNSDCYVEDWEVMLEDQKDANAVDTELQEMLSWSYPDGVIDYISCEGAVDGRYGLDCDIEITYHVDYWGEADADIEYSNVKITEIIGDVK